MKGSQIFENTEEVGHDTLKDGVPQRGHWCSIAINELSESVYYQQTIGTSLNWSQK